jgi:hypothetical protein
MLTHSGLVVHIRGGLVLLSTEERNGLLGFSLASFLVFAAVAGAGRSINKSTRKKEMTPLASVNNA